MIDSSKNTSLLQGTRSAPGSALIVNLFGGPGIGKTTLAARLFAALKSRDVEAVFPEEYAKIALWQGRDYLLDNQLILLGRTWDTVSTLSFKVDVIILDSPILLCSPYAGDTEPDYFHKTVLDYHQRHDRMNVLLCRSSSTSYSTSGRRETSQQAIGIDQQVQALLEDVGESHLSIDPTVADLESLVDEICLHVRDRNTAKSFQ